MRTRHALWWTLTAMLALALVVTTVFGTWQLIRANQPTPADSAPARQIVLDTAKTSTAKMLTYSPQNVESELNDAVSLTTGAFRTSYSDLIHDVVIPGAKQKRISAVAEVPAVAVESLTARTATLIVFVNQRVTAGSDQPSDTASSVRMRLEQVNGSWLVAEFEPL